VCLLALGLVIFDEKHERPGEIFVEPRDVCHSWDGDPSIWVGDKQLGIKQKPEGGNSYKVLKILPFWYIHFHQILILKRKEVREQYIENDSTGPNISLGSI
jgi:hypothetical protein